MFGYAHQPKRTSAFILRKAYDLSEASFTGKEFLLSGQDGAVQDIFWKPDGTKMFASGAANDTIYQYTASVPHNVDSLSFDSKSFSVASEATAPVGFSFKSDGTKMFVLDAVSKKIYQYTLSTPWDISTASFDSVSHTIAEADTSWEGIFVREDGLKLFLVGASTDTVYQYSLSGSWDASTITFDSKSFNVGSQDGGATGIFFKPDGTKMFVVGLVNDKIYQYSLTAWDVSTASFDSISFDISAQSTSPRDMFVSSDGLQFYTVDVINDKVSQYVV